MPQRGLGIGGEALVLHVRYVQGTHKTLEKLPMSNFLPHDVMDEVLHGFIERPIPIGPSGKVLKLLDAAAYKGEDTKKQTSNFEA